MNNQLTTTSSSSSMTVPMENPPTSGMLPEIPPDIIYPNELNNFLREQLRFYVQENGMLQQNLNDLEARYVSSKENFEKLEEKLNTYEKFGDRAKIVTSSQVATSKIVELSKKLREKNSEVASLRTKCSKIEKYAFDLKQQIENVAEPSGPETSPKIVNEEELKRQNERLSNLTNKFSEINNLNLQLKQELKLAKKFLQQESGDTFENLQNSTGWRGRAQQIIDLQNKNADLKEKLKAIQCTNPIEAPASTSSKTDTRLIALTKEYEELKNKHEEVKKKHDVLKARHNVLDVDYTLLKSKSTMLKDQATRDQEVINSLLGQLNSSKEIRNDMVSQKERCITKLQTEKKHLMQEIEEYKSVIKKLREDLNVKELERGRTTNLENKKEEKIVANHKDKSMELAKILELVESVNQKLKAEREAHARTHSSLITEKQKVVKCEAAIARMELQTTSRFNYSSTSSLKSLGTNLQDRFELAEEQMKALQARLEFEQMERKNDLQQFGEIIKAYEANKT